MYWRIPTKKNKFINLYELQVSVVWDTNLQRIFKDASTETVVYCKFVLSGFCKESKWRLSWSSLQIICLFFCLWAWTGFEVNLLYRECFAKLEPLHEGVIMKAWPQILETIVELYEMNFNLFLRWRLSGSVWLVNIAGSWQKSFAKSWHTLLYLFNGNNFCSLDLNLWQLREELKSSLSCANKSL